MDALRESLSEYQMMLISHSLPFLVEDQQLRLPGEPSRLRPAVALEDPRALFAREMAMAKQSTLARKLHKGTYDWLLEEFLERGEYTRAAWVRSAATSTQRQTARWIKGGLFLNTHNRLPENLFLPSLRLRLLVSADYGMEGTCGCAYRVPISDSTHLLACQAAQVPLTARHDYVLGAVSAFCKACVGPQGKVQEEVQWVRRGELAACRLDIVVRTAVGEEHILDIAVVNCSAKSYVFGPDANPFVPREEGAAFKPGWAAEMKSDSKRSKARLCMAADQLSRFVPFCVEATGRLGDEAAGFVAQMGACHNARVGDGAPAAFRQIKAKLFLELGMILARGNAKILEESRACIRVRPYAVADGPDEDGFYNARDAQQEEEDLADGIRESFFFIPHDIEDGSSLVEGVASL
jgi:hypothetical protein